jgi:hypothetical protein
MPINWDDLEPLDEDDPIFSDKPHFGLKDAPQRVTFLTGPLKPKADWVAELKSAEEDSAGKPADD